MVLKSSHMALNVTQSCMCLEEGHLFISHWYYSFMVLIFLSLLLLNIKYIIHLYLRSMLSYEIFCPFQCLVVAVADIKVPYSEFPKFFLSLFKAMF